jgi:prolipoprotein diacylglyceryl transferase
VSLAAIPSPSTAVWDLGPIPIRAYALFIVLGIVAACVVAEVRMRRRGAPPYLVLDIAVWAVPLGIIGARVYHVITSPDAYFGKGGHPVEAFEIWHGGLGIWGAIAGGVLGAWIACRQRGVPLVFVADAAAPGLPLAQALGRWGNWFNNELYGRPTSLPWGLRVHVMDDHNPGHALIMDGKPVLQEGMFQPTFLYESLWDIGVAILVWQLDKRHRFGRGRAFALYAMAYTAGRFWVEALRVDTAHHFLGLRLNDWTSLVVFVVALVYFVRVRGPQERLYVDDDGQLAVGRDSEAAVTGSAGAAGAAEDAPAGDGAAGDSPAGDSPAGDRTAGDGTATAAPPVAEAAGGEAASGDATGAGAGGGDPVATVADDDETWRAERPGGALDGAPDADLAVSADGHGPADGGAPHSTAEK